MSADESGTPARFNALRPELLDSKIAQFKGRIVGSAGGSHRDAALHLPNTSPTRSTRSRASPGLLQIERNLTVSQDEQEKRRHRIQVWSLRNRRPDGVCAILCYPATGFRLAGADPRRECYALD